MNIFNNNENFILNDSNHSVFIGDTLFYVFDSFESIEIIEGIIININVNLSNNFKYSFNIACSNTGKEYHAQPNLCFSNYKNALNNLIIKIQKNIKNIQSNYNVYYNLYTNINDLFLKKFDNEIFNSNYQTKNILNHSFRFFEPHEKVYFYYDPKFLNNKTIVPVFLGEITSFSGITTFQSPSIKYSIEHDYDDFIVEDSDIFYSEKEAVFHSLIKIQEKINSLTNKINYLSDILENSLKKYESLKIN